MINVLKQIFSFILPITVLVIVPLWIEKDWTADIRFSFFCGSIVILLGLTIMTLCISSFIRIGKGTLAPWSPTKKLVIKGLYRYVRNPMILGVLIVLLGEALALKFPTSVPTSHSSVENAAERPGFTSSSWRHRPAAVERGTPASLVPHAATGG